jgi:DNA-binding HxlR family transcriptional regulator
VTEKRHYDDSCGMAQGLNVVGDRWALHVVRELLLGPKRFVDLRGDLPGISSNVLSQRLAELAERDVLRRRRLPPPAAVWVYELTEWGAELEPVILQLGRWANRSPRFGGEAPLGSTSAVLSMRAMFRPELAAGVSLRIGVRLPGLTVEAQVDDGVLEVVPVESPSGSAAVVTVTPERLARLLFDQPDLDVAVEGDRAAVERYLACFQLPEQN